MPLDLDEYRKRLDAAQAAAGVRAVSGMSRPVIGGGAVPEVPQMAPEPASPAGAGPMIGGPAAPAQANGMRRGPPRTAQAPPPSAKTPRPTFDVEKLKDVKDVPGLVEAMPKKAQGAYLTAWEKAHGSIEDKYHAILKEMGQRPDPNRKVDRKEMFSMLMEFGLNLMQNSQVDAQHPMGDTGGGAINAIGSTIRNQQGIRAQEVQRYDAIGGQVRAEHDAQLKELGTLPAAVDKQSAIDLRDSEIRKNDAYEPAAAKKQTVVSDQGIMDISGPTARPIIGANGKPLTSTKKFAPEDKRGTVRKNYDDLLKIGFSEAEAKDLAKPAKAKGEEAATPEEQAQADYLRVYEKSLSAMNYMEDADENQAKAKKFAQQFVDEKYGQGVVVSKKRKQREFDPASGAFH